MKGSKPLPLEDTLRKSFSSPVLAVLLLATHAAPPRFTLLQFTLPYYNLPYYNLIVASVKEPSPWNAEAYFYPPNQRIVRQTSQLRPYSTQLGISTSTSGTHLGLRQGSRVRRRCRQSFIAGQCTVPTPTLPRLRPR